MKYYTTDKNKNVSFIIKMTSRYHFVFFFIINHLDLPLYKVLIFLTKNKFERQYLPKIIAVLLE